MQPPNLHRMWETFLRIGPCERHTFDHGLHIEPLRKEVVPVVKELRSAGIADWFSLMIHDDVTFGVSDAPRNDALWHLRLALVETATPDDLRRRLPGRFEALRPMPFESAVEIGGLNHALLKSGFAADDWMMLGVQTEWLLAMVDLYREDADPVGVARDLRQHEHLFANPIYPEFTRPYRLTGVAPQFLVLDLHAACAFYVEKLGFRVAFVSGDFYAGVERDGIMIHLKLADAPDPSRHLKQRDEHLDAYFSVSDVGRLYEEYQRRGVTFAQPLADTRWGTREFAVWDNSGYILYFGQN